MTREFRYAPRVVAAGYARSAVGLIVTLGPLIFLQPAVWLLPVLTVAAGLFLIFAATVAARHTACIVLSATGIAARGLFGATIPWAELRSVEFNYYSTRNDRSNGWIELVVRGMHGVVRVQSVLDGFSELAGCVAREALRHDCPLDERARTHLAAIGIDVGERPALEVQSSHGISHA